MNFGQEVCQDGVDNDQNGFMDCEEFGCRFDADNCIVVVLAEPSSSVPPLDSIAIPSPWGVIEAFACSLIFSIS